MRDAHVQKHCRCLQLVQTFEFVAKLVLQCPPKDVSLIAEENSLLRFREQLEASVDWRVLVLFDLAQSANHTSVVGAELVR